MTREVAKEEISLEGLNESQKKAIEYIKQHTYITSRDYQRINDIGKVMAVRELNQLINRKILKKTGKGKSTQYVVNE